MYDHAKHQRAGAKESARRLLLPTRVKRRGEALLHQQCWAWGRDVRHAEGNLLLEYGFEKFRPPDEVEGSTAYRLDLSGDAVSLRSLTLWGFGLYYASAERAGGIFLNRFKFTPMLSDTVKLDLPLWKMEQLPASRVPNDLTLQDRALGLLAEACALIEAYERWVRAVVGAQYRHRCLAEFEHTKFTPEQAIDEWHAMGQACRSRSRCRSKRLSGSEYRDGSSSERRSAIATIS